MALDNYPKRCDCPRHSHPKNTLFPYTTHQYSAPCPLGKHGFPRGPHGNCCSLNGTIAARELKALGEDAISLRMRDDMSCVEAEAFARQLHNAADRLEKRHAGDVVKPCGAGWIGCWNGWREEVEYQEFSTFDEAIASIRQAASWYKEVAGGGFGVSSVVK